MIKSKHYALNAIWGWLDAWRAMDNIRPIDEIRISGKNTYIDMQDPGEYTVLNIAKDEMRAFMEHRKEFEPAMKWIVAHEYGHHRGWNLANSGLKDPINWTSKECQDYADAFAYEKTGITHQQARDLVHRLAPGATWRDKTMTITRKDAEPILKAFRKAGFKPELIGSLAKKGYSSHDIDIVVPFIAEGIVDDPMEFPEYARYHKVMEGLGFKMIWEGKLFEIGREYDEVELETWKKSNLLVDIYPMALEPGIDIPLKEARKRVKRKGIKAPATLKGIR